MSCFCFHRFPIYKCASTRLTLMIVLCPNNKHNTPNNIDFEPIGHSLQHNARMEMEDVDSKYKADAKKGFGGHENDNNGLPPYIIQGTPEEPNWRRTHPTGWHNQNPSNSFTTGSTPVHLAAQAGNLDALRKHVEKSKDVVHSKDANGWTPLHGTRSTLN